MVDDDELERLRDLAVPAPDSEAKARAFAAAMQAFDLDENISTAPQGSATGLRLTERAHKLWRDIMQRKLIATPAITTLVALPIAGYAAFEMHQILIATVNNLMQRCRQPLCAGPFAPIPYCFRPFHGYHRHINSFLSLYVPSFSVQFVYVNYI